MCDHIAGHSFHGVAIHKIGSGEKGSTTYGIGARAPLCSRSSSSRSVRTRFSLEDRTTITFAKLIEQTSGGRLPSPPGIVTQSS
jgi:hypothetical protein